MAKILKKKLLLQSNFVLISTKRRLRSNVWQRTSDT